jgi:phospholipase/lecithinase/hemolysin
MVSADLTTLLNPFDTLVSTCDTPDEFYFWDQLHPTAAVSKLVGADVAAMLEALL